MRCYIIKAVRKLIELVAARVVSFKGNLHLSPSFPINNNTEEEEAKRTQKVYYSTGNLLAMKSNLKILKHDRTIWNNNLYSLLPQK